ncbi:MAG: hypothetical protein RLY71_3741 [Pseudomonadota bacterium]|jgi:DNA-binding response OmpR family regulator
MQPVPINRLPMEKILIIEDHAEIRLLIRATLDEEHREISEAADAASGWDAALQIRPDIVLLDIMMPGGMDGLELCRRLKTDARTCQAKVVLVSARGHRNDVSIGLDAGADDYILKPFSPERLAQTVRTLCLPE